MAATLESKTLPSYFVAERAIDDTRRDQASTWEGLYAKLRKAYPYPPYVITWEGMAGRRQ